MATRIKNNLTAVRSLNTLNKNSRAAQKDLRKVATGERINSAADDASAWGISERMREKIRSLDQANQNEQNDMVMMRTAEGAVANIVDTLRTLKAKAIDAANDSNTDDDRRIMQKEVNQLLDQFDDNALVTFNGKALVNGKTYTRTEKVGDCTLTNLCNATNDIGGSTPATSAYTSHGYACLVSTDSLYQLSGITITIRDGNEVFSTATTFHVGAGANQSMSIGFRDMRSVALGVKSKDGQHNQHVNRQRSSVRFDKP